MEFSADNLMVQNLLILKETGSLPDGASEDFTNADLSGADLRGIDLTGFDLSGADFSRANLSNAHLFKANLQGAILIDAILDGAEMSGANFSNAMMEGVKARRAGFGMANFTSANMFKCNLEGSTLSLANFDGCDLRNSRLMNVRLREAVVTNVDFTNADLRNADMSLTKVTGASFANADMREARLRLIDGFDKASWIGVDIRNVNFAGAYRLRRYVHDQNFIKEFRASGKVAAFVYYLWWISSDCGRSMFRWCFWIMFQTFFFAWVFTFFEVDYGPHFSVLSPLYFSVITLTTLGYGDVIPASTGAQLVAMVEVILGYVMLGGLLSIFSNKIARRAD